MKIDRGGPTADLNDPIVVVSRTLLSPYRHTGMLSTVFLSSHLVRLVFPVYLNITKAVILRQSQNHQNGISTLKLIRRQSNIIIPQYEPYKFDRYIP